MKKQDIQVLDMDDPKMDVSVEGDPGAVHKSITPERPDAAQFNALSGTRNRMYDIAHASAIRGNLQTDVATSNQIAREGDFTVSDDEVENTINPAYEWISDWQMQFIKKFYTQDHIHEILGPKGDATYHRLRGDSISDGMEVKIKASSTDKLKAQRTAMDSAKLGPPFTNPIDFFTDMDFQDIEGRTERGMMFAIDPQGYFTKYVLKLDNVAQQAGAINQAAQQPGIPGQVPQPPIPGTPQPQPMQGQPQGPTPTDTTQVASSPPTDIAQASPRAL
jgi:hypothetical protein